MKEIAENLYFNTPIWKTAYPEYVKDLNKLCDPYIKKIRKENLKKFKKDFGLSHHSNNLNTDNTFKFLRDIVIGHSNDFMTNSGFDILGKKCMLTELWAQEFSKKAGGHHSTHVHWNQHVSGFYFLKCSDKTSFPKFYDPRAGAMMTKIKQIDPEKITPATDTIHFKIKPGDMIIFPGYLPHEFEVDGGIEPFRFIHWNIQYV
tara:strand:+ start:3078 stop:3686 length:609 start_codon:yes stop_codon:yes gene_type:complete